MSGLRFPPSRRAAGALGGAALPKYLLYDAFTDTRAAGAVNGTPSTPPAGVQIVGAVPSRVVDTDPGPTMVVSGGQLSWVSAIAKIHSSLSITRSPGVVLLVDVPSYVTEARLSFGNSLVNPVDTILVSGGSGTIQLYLSGNFTTGFPNMGGTSNNRLAIVARSSGVYFFVKGNNFSNWTLIYSHSSGTYSPLYTQLWTNNAATPAYKNWRVPVALFTKLPMLSYSAWGAADGALGNSDASGADAQTLTPLAWAVQNGAISIASHKASITDTGGGMAIATLPTASADGFFRVPVTRTGGNGGLVLRYQDANNYLYAYTNGTNAKLDKVVAGSITNVISGAVTYGAQDNVDVDLSGTAARLYYNGTLVNSGTVPASTYTNHGLGGTDTSCLFGAVSMWPKGTGNEYAWLDGV